MIVWFEIVSELRLTKAEIMGEDWILQQKETKRTFASSTWIPLRESSKDEQNEIRAPGFVSEIFACGSVAFPPEHREVANRLSWSEIGTGHSAKPYAYEDGYYASIEQFQYHDKTPIGVNLVFAHPQPVVGGSLWILNPDLIVALRLIKEGNEWVRPEENFTVVVREVFTAEGSHCRIEIKREFLLDYLAARNLALRLSYYRQRVENITSIEQSPYANLVDMHEERDGGRFELRVRSLDDVFGGSWATFRMWRTDVDEDDDAPIMGPESDDNVGTESSRGHRSGYIGTRIEGEFWRDEWIEHNGQSVRIRGDIEKNLPSFIVETDGSRMSSKNLDDEDIGRWLWFRPGIIRELLKYRGFSLEWYTSETGGINSTSGYTTTFGLNASDLVTVYAYDVARLDAWEQHIWAAHNVVPDGKVSGELLAAQVRTDPAGTHAVEFLLFKAMRMLETGFQRNLEVALYTHDIDDNSAMQYINRFASTDQGSLLTLAKELVRVFSDRLDVGVLRKLAGGLEKDKFGSIKLLQNLLAKSAGAEKAREVFGVIVGVYEMRLGDAHPTSSKIRDAILLAKINDDLTYLQQGEQLISNFGEAIWSIGKLLFAPPQRPGD
jgi:hypothetical protein